MVSNDNLDQNNNFIKEVAKYFMNFLETDFHKTNLPKRNSISKIVKGYKVGLDLEKYKKLKKDFYTIFYNGFKKDSINIKKGNYTSTISEHIFKLINSKIKNLDEELLKITFNEIELNLKDIKKVNIKNYQLYLEESQKTIQTIFIKYFIVPFLDTIEEPLQTLELVDQNGLYQIEGELSDSLYSVFENILLNILQSYYEYTQDRKENNLDYEKDILKFNLIEELEKNILLEELKANIELFFKNISVSDAFDDIYILFKNNKLLDKTELYLYMYEISAGKHTFPLFYLPLKLEEKKGSFELIFDQKLYVNTKAIDYVVQEYNRETPDSSGTLAGNYDRIIYINDDYNFIEKIKWIVDSIQNFFKFTKTLDVESSDYQKIEHLISGFSNKSYVYLCDNSDESVINDYEEILNNNDGILDQFSLLLNDFIESNPVNFEEEINNEWQSKTVSNKLIFESPIPLNDEQKQVVMALGKKDCKVLTLEGPPGTGKSHTITAIICKALLDAKSVLVLSDKKEALDVIEEKITETLNKVRKDDDFLNPILRLGKSGNKFGKIVQGQTINKIAEHYSAYKHKKPDLDKEKESLLKLMEENLEKNISHYNNISIHDIKYYFNNVDKFLDINWVYDENIDEVKEFILLIKEVLSKIGDIKGFDINLFNLSKENIKLIYDLLLILENIKKIREDNEDFINRDKDIYIFLGKEKLLNEINSYIKNIDTKSSKIFDFPYIENNKIEKFEDYKNFASYIQTLLSKNKEFSDLGKYSILSNLKSNIDYEGMLEDIGIFIDKTSKIDKEHIDNNIFIEKKYYKYFKLNEKLQTYLGNDKSILYIMDNFKLLDYSNISEANDKLGKFIDEIEGLKSKVFGYLFKKNKVDNITIKIKSVFYSYNNIDTLSKINEIKKIYNLNNFILNLLKNGDFKEFDYEFIYKFLNDYKLDNNLIDNSKNTDINKELELLINKKLDNYQIIKSYFDINIFDEIYGKLDELENILTIISYINDDGNNFNKEYLLEYFKYNLNNKNEKLSKELILLYDSLNVFFDKINNYNSSLFNYNISELTFILNYIDLNIEINKYLEIFRNNNFSFEFKLDNKELLLTEILSKYIEMYQQVLIDINKLYEIKDLLDDLNIKQSKLSQFSKNIEFDIKNTSITKISSIILEYDDSFIDEYLKFKKIENNIFNNFENIPEDIFSDGIKNVEDQMTAEMAYFLDKRIVEYTRNYSKEVNTLKGIISKKKKFPKGLFANLKNAFPCILAGIRDYSDYIPLEKDLFDLIIIDEASQVSIAQSLPALIRGKKIIILGDDKQFSNVKSNNASKIVNQEYKTNVRRTFIEERLDGKDDEFGWLENVGNFDIKYSILKFSQSIQNYKCQLRKHFRGYPEIISYSNKFFYEGTLQCMKIRGKSIEDVIKIDVIPYDGLIDTAKNTNQLEVDYIIEKILQFKSKGIEQSLGIITPHQHQASLLQDKISELSEKDWIFKTCKLKIMTFDSCQGEERDYIFYSMVATEEKDRLTYIFIKDLKSIESEENGSVRAQRLNVGFSRAKECMHFVLSKPIENFSGEIKNALLHYKNELEAGKKVKLGGTDENSPMEKKIQEYFYETQFYKNNNDSIEFIPQFDIGKYLRQLDRGYNHPAYKVDFLLIYKNKKVVIEYDGFKEHFEDLGSVDKYNYESYMKSDDIYRQKVLEGYGYKFLRINRFNIGENPVETLDFRLNELFKEKRRNTDGLEVLYNQIDKLQDGDERECISCGEIFESKYFPYKTKYQCVNCYEKEYGKTLWSFREKLNYYEKNGRKFYG